MLNIEIDKVFCNKKQKKKTSQIDAIKSANQSDEIFDYIYIAKCRRLFSLTSYNNKTYLSPSTS